MIRLFKVTVDHRVHASYITQNFETFQKILRKVRKAHLGMKFISLLREYKPNPASKYNNLPNANGKIIGINLIFTLE